MADVTCGNCGTALDEPDSLKPEERKPCPVCGSTTRQLPAAASMQGAGAMAAQAEVVTYPRRLLTMARGLIDQGEPSIAVVVAHMACEVATERRLSEAFVTKGVQFLKDAVMTGSFSGYSLSNDKIRKLYVALTGDKVQQNQTAPGVPTTQPYHFMRGLR
jgi:hypothetical protein